MGFLANEEFSSGTNLNNITGAKQANKTKTEIQKKMYLGHFQKGGYVNLEILRH